MQIKWSPVSPFSTQSRAAENSQGTYNGFSVSPSSSGGRAALLYCLVSAREMNDWNNRQVPAKSTVSAPAMSFENKDFYSLTLQPH